MSKHTCDLRRIPGPRRRARARLWYCPTCWRRWVWMPGRGWQ